MRAFARSLSLILCCFISFYLQAQQMAFSWKDRTNGLNYHIDLHSRELKEEIAPNQWKVISRIDIGGINLKDLPNNYLTNSFVPGNPDNIYFTVIGTGQVYQLNKGTSKISRLDSTYYRGYNFNSCQFIRKDTIYSFGGSGFWRYNATLTYYDWKLREWEWFHPKNAGPKAITSYFSGYEAGRDIFYSALNPEPDDYGQKNPARDKNIFALNLKNKKWQLLGTINRNIIISPAEPVIWSGRYFFQCNDGFLLIVDPEENKVYKYDDEKSIFTSIADVDGRTLAVKYQKFNGKYVLESFSIQNIIKAAKYSGPFYYDQSANSRIYWFAGLGIILISVIAGFVIKRSVSNNVKCSVALSETQITVLKAIISKGKEGTISTWELNALLNIENKSTDNQRKIRADFITEINQLIAVKYEINDCIDRKPSNDDRRVMQYFLNQKGYDLFSRLYDIDVAIHA